ncbi:DUF6443 domain-containing protein [Reichenbachiella sp.]|uniref:DUF6443 domain-containing protein n=2 Tax=Reichenbachiella sp. TaxID=2184521 RepID=UPI0032983BFF
MNRLNKKNYLLVLLIFICGVSFGQLPPPSGGGSGGSIFGHTAVCQSTAYNYASTSNNGPYIWTVDGGYIDGPSNGSGISVVWTNTTSGSINVSHGSGSANLNVVITGKVSGGVSGTSSICYNTSTTLTTGVSSIVRWEKSTNGGSTWSTISHTAASYNTGNLITTTQYKVIYSSGGCAERETSPKTVSVSSALVAGSISGGKSINYDSPGGTLGNTASGSGGSSYQWQKQESGQAGFSNISGATGSTYNPGHVTITTSYRRAYSGSCGTVYSNTQTISVNVVPGFGGNGIFGREAVCQSSAYNYAAMSNSGPYIWTVSGGHINGSSSGSGISVTWTHPTSGSLHLSYDNGNGSANMNVNITSKVSGGINGTSTLCYNTGTTLTTTVGSIVRWEKSTNGGSTWSAINNTTGSYPTGNLTATTKYRVIYNSGSCAERETGIKTIAIDNPMTPGSISGSKSISYNTSGGTMGNSQSGSGGHGTSTYQWQKQEVGQSGFSNISGATSSTYGPGNVTITTNYRRGYSNSCGTIYSNTQTITVNVIPGFGGNGIFGREAVCQSTAYNYAAMSDTGPYLWTISGGHINGSSSGSGISVIWTNGTTGSLHLSYDNGNGSANMSVNITSKVSGGISGTSTLCYDTGTTLTTTVGSIVRWEKSTNGGSTWSAINNTTGSYPTGNLTTTTKYRVIYNSGSCAERETGVKTITVSNVLAPGIINGTQTINYNTSASTLGNHTSASGGHGTSTYQWQKKEEGEGGFTNILGATAANYNPGNVTITTHYRRGYTNSCGTIYSNEQTVVINVIPGNDIFGQDSVCQLSTYNYAAMSATGPYIWTVSGGYIDGPSGGSQISVVWTHATSGSLHVSYDNGNGSANLNVNIGLKVNGNIGGESNICYNTSTNLTTAVTPIVRWEKSTSGGSTWSQINHIAGSYPTGNLTNTTLYKVISGGVCSEAETAVHTVNVDALTVPGTLSGGDEAFGEKSGTLNLEGETGAVMRWEKKEAGGNWQTVSNTTTTLTYANVTTTTEYRAIVKNGDCSELESGIATVTIYDIPTINITGDTEIHFGDSVILSTNSGYYSYQWIKDGVDLSGKTTTDLVVRIPASYKLRVEATNGGITYTTEEVTVTEAIVNQNRNYITTIDIYKPEIAHQDQLFDLNAEDLQVTTAYFDGLGRTIQSVSLGSSPNGKDVVQPVVYDQYGRQTKNYLPYVKDERTGTFIDNVVDTPAQQYTGSLHQLFYQNEINVATDNRPFSETVYEASPLNRIDKQYGPGEDWKKAGIDRPISYTYEVNNITDSVKLWVLTANMPVTTANYEAGELYKNVTTDEETHQVIEFTDKLGRTVLKRVEAPDTDNHAVTKEWADTYYVYDDFGNLRFVLPPEAINNLDQYNN